MSAAVETASVATPLLCSGCRTPLLLAGAIATATGRCADCAPTLPPIAWDFIERGNSLDFIECNYYERCLSTTDGAVAINDGDVVGHAVRRYCTLSAERSRSAGEVTYNVEHIDGSCPDAETLDELAYDLHSKRRRYQGKVTTPGFARAAAMVVALEAERQADAEYRAEVLHDAEERAHAGECGEVSL